jgi:hypothetical protein
MATRLSGMGVEVWKTMSAVSPDCDGKRAARMFCACCDGVLPAVNLFSKCVPTTWASTVTTMMARIHATSTVRRRS